MFPSHCWYHNSSVLLHPNIASPSLPYFHHPFNGACGRAQPTAENKHEYLNLYKCIFSSSDIAISLCNVDIPKQIYLPDKILLNLDKSIDMCV